MKPWLFDLLRELLYVTLSECLYHYASLTSYTTLLLVINFNGILLGDVAVILTIGLSTLCSSLTSSKLKKWKYSGIVNFSVTSAKVLPRQMRMPPLNGTKLAGLRFLPSGVRLRSLALSKRSGRNSNGRYHSLSLLCKPYMQVWILSPLRNWYFPSFASSFRK